MSLKLDGWSLLGKSTLVLLLVLLGVCVRRRYFSAISDIPGPFIATFSTSLWQLWYILRGDTEEAVIRLHQKHGTFVRIGQNEVSVCDGSAIREILMSHMDKGPTYAIFSMPDKRYMNQMSIRDCKTHIHRAKNLASGYTLSNILRTEPYIDRALQLLSEQIDKISLQKQPIKFEQWINYLTFDILGEAMFSQSFGFLESGKDLGGTVSNNVYLRIYIAILGHFPWAHDVLLANPLIEYFNLKPALHVMDTCVAAIGARAKNDEVRRDMLEQWREHLLKHPDRMDEKEILANAIGNLGAGGDTASSVLQALVYHTIRDRDILEKLQQELDEAPLSGIPSYEETQKLPLLQACIKETYRFHPPVGFGLSRIAPEAGVTVCGRYFPAGTILSVNPWAIHRMTSLFGENAAQFDPRRWLDIERAVKMSQNLITFGAGYNQCPGRHLAHVEVSKAAATLIKNFEFELVDPEKEWKYENYFTVSPHSWPVWARRRCPL